MVWEVSNPFKLWLGGEMLSWQASNFFLLLPIIIAAMPFGTSYYTDVKTGFIKNILVRCKKRHYIIGKIIATFLSGAVAVILPLIFSFLFSIATLPSITPISETFSYPINYRSMWGEMYYSEPFKYVIFYIIIIFMFSGLIATFSLVFSFFIKNKLAVLVSPFICIF